MFQLVPCCPEHRALERQQAKPQRQGPGGRDLISENGLRPLKIMPWRTTNMASMHTAASAGREGGPRGHPKFGVTTGAVKPGPPLGTPQHKGSASPSPAGHQGLQERRMLSEQLSIPVQFIHSFTKHSTSPAMFLPVSLRGSHGLRVEKPVLALGQTGGLMPRQPHRILWASVSSSEG